MSFIAFWHCCTKGDVILADWRAFRAAWLSEQIKFNRANTVVFLWPSVHKHRTR